MNMRVSVLLGWCVLLGIKMSAIAQAGDCTPTITAEDATIIIPADAGLEVDGMPLPNGSIIQVLFDNGGVLECGGATVWEGNSTFITIYGDDGDNPGFQEGEPYHFRLILPSGCATTTVDAAFLSGGIFDNAGFYTTDGLSGLASLAGTTGFSIDLLSALPDTCSAGVGSVIVTVANGAYPVQYQWAGMGQDSIAAGLFAGDVTMVTATDANGCSAAASFEVEGIEVFPTVELGDDFFLCEGATATLSGNMGGASYTWYYEGFLIPGAVGPSLAIDTSGLFSLEVANSAGCRARDSVFVALRPLPAVNLGIDTAICLNESLVLDATCSGCTYQWNTGADSPMVTVSEAGLYSVSVTNTWACMAESSLQLGILELPEVALGPDDTFCTGEEILLEAEDVLGYSYLWSTGETSSAIVVTGPGGYSLSVTDSNACTASDTILLTFIPSVEAAIDAASTFICLGDSLQLRAQGGAAFQWINGAVFISDVNAPVVYVRPDTTTLFAVAVSNECFSDTAVFELTVVELKATAGQDTCIAKGTTAMLNATGGASYEWELSEYPLSDYHIPNPGTEPLDSAYYVVTITGPYGCSLRDSVLVAVASGDPRAHIQPVNILTPNGDGKNDVLKFAGLEKYSKNKLSVFNRWGNIVFTQLHYDNNWDGTYKGRRLPEGVYYYVLQINDVEIKSALTIIYE